MSICEEDLSNSNELFTLNNLPVWERLHRLATVSTFLKSRQYQKLTSFNNISDSLDFALHSCYRHEKDFNLNRAQVIKQSVKNR